MEDQRASWCGSEPPRADRELLPIAQDVTPTGLRHGYAVAKERESGLDHEGCTDAERGRDEHGGRDVRQQMPNGNAAGAGSETARGRDKIALA